MYTAKAAQNKTLRWLNHIQISVQTYAQVIIYKDTTGKTISCHQNLVWLVEWVVTLRPQSYITVTVYITDTIQHYITYSN